ncbi:MAG: type II secretion system protein GspL [Gammaproteobacteria bacterium]|uniref:type II secretion system protein GspL n=1 Tax=Azohydromonas sp. TaxID=1872666 RepID=UPI002CD128E3|nr:type II secretion system protein GspL [Azohydromonas sp.]HMM84455.1 type II secretion system protein GspL [Azohydromonas sp.]
MSLLVILIPPRERLRAGGGAPAARPGGEFAYVLSDDGLTPRRHGRSAAALLPRADSVVAVLADGDVGWHRVTLPKAPPARLRAALAGVLEDALLDEPEAMHFALAPGAVSGQPTWVAAVHKAWLAAHIAVLEQAGRSVERVLPSTWPDEPPHGHFWLPDDADAGGALTLAWSDAQGVVQMRVQGTLARAWLAQRPGDGVRWTASPAAAAPAERWLGAPVQVLGDDERALQPARTLWNLRQFDLAPRHRGTRALRDLLQRLRSPAWRPVRLGLAALAALHLVGLNLWAWQQRSAIDERRQAMVELLRSTHPQVRAVLDAPLQMQRETAVLRGAAGRAGASDLEALLDAAAGAWPEPQGPAQTLRYEGDSLSFAAAGWDEAQVEAFRRRLRADGWQLESVDGRLRLSRAGGAGVRS